MASAGRNLEVSPLTPHVGAEIHGLDLAEPLDETAQAQIRETLNLYGVVFFRDQDLTPDQQLAFAELWGEINVNRFFKPVPDNPRVAEVRKEPDQTENIGSRWHTDHSYDLAPALGSVLYAKELPEVGGDTLFASMAAAYEALSEGFKQTLEGLRARHSSRHVFGENTVTKERIDDDRLGNADQATQDAVHPLVLTHPVSGRKGLYVNPTFTVGIEGWHEAESKALLEFLYAHAGRPEFTCRFRWAPGSVAFWDNRATWHQALNDYHGSRRLMHRVTIEGVPLS